MPVTYIHLSIIVAEMAKILFNYINYDRENNKISQKVCFLGLSLYPNIPSIPNFDIMALYKAFQSPLIEASIHDPHISGAVESIYGIPMGRQRTERWTHSYDALILSTPHQFYLDNMDKLYNLFIPTKPCALLDMWGVMSPDYMPHNDRVDIHDMSTVVRDHGLLGGECPPDSRIETN